MTKENYELKTTNPYGTTKLVIEGVNVNKVTVTGLKPGKRYYYLRRLERLLS